MASRQSQLLSWLNSVTPFQLSTLEQVSGDASFRRYFRFNVDGNDYIAVDAPPETENTRGFVELAKAYQASNVGVPEVLESDIELGFMCLEDFGDTLLGEIINDSNYQEYYGTALEQLIDIQVVQTLSGEPLPLYDDVLLAKEYTMFTHWLLGTHLNMTLSAQDNVMLQQAFDLLTLNFKEQPQVGVHRDYHSRNIMVLEGETLGIIDFQDAVIGPLTYDAISLTRDCYVRWPEQCVHSLLVEWYKKHFTEYAWGTFKRWFDLTGIQRHVKASGIFARLNYRDNKPIYLDDIPRTLGYIIDVGKEYAELGDFIGFVEHRVLPELRGTK